MPNKSHYNAGHIGMNHLLKEGKNHSSHIEIKSIDKTYHALYIEDAVEFLKNNGHIVEENGEIIILSKGFAEEAFEIYEK